MPNETYVTYDMDIQTLERYILADIMAEEDRRVNRNLTTGEWIMPTGAINAGLDVGAAITDVNGLFTTPTIGAGHYAQANHRAWEPAPATRNGIVRTEGLPTQTLVARNTINKIRVVRFEGDADEEVNAIFPDVALVGGNEAIRIKTLSYFTLQIETDRGWETIPVVDTVADARALRGVQNQLAINDTPIQDPQDWERGQLPYQGDEALDLPTPVTTNIDWGVREVVIPNNPVTFQEDRPVTAQAVR